MRPVLLSGQDDDTPSDGDWNFAGILNIDGSITQVEPPIE